MKNRTPSRQRDIMVVVDKTGRPTVFSDFGFASRSMLTSDGDNVTATFDAHGRVQGFRMHQAIQMSDSGVPRFDSASLRRMAERAQSQTTREPLDAAAQNRVRVLVAWLLKRCPT
jgi:hypothetical protein